jgi:5-methylcytosine-specific restriction endonuclease McrA
METKKCSCCQIYQPIDRFYRKTSQQVKFRARCKLCTRQKSQLYYQDNHDVILQSVKDYKTKYPDRISLISKEYSQAYNKKWKENNPDKWITHKIKKYIKLLDRPISDNDASTVVRSLLDKWNAVTTCPYTGEPLTVHTAGLDHIIPRSRGGSLIDPNNLQWVSKVYNSAKHTMTDEEFARHWKLTWIP